MCVLSDYYIFQMIGIDFTASGLLLLSPVKVLKGMMQKTCSFPRWSVLRGEVVPGAAAPSILPSGSVGPVAEPAGVSVLAHAAPEALAHRQPGTLTVHSLWTSVA